MSSTTKARECCAILRDRIRRYSFEPGHPLRICSIADQLNLSPIPVREALAVLAAEGLLLAVPQRGYIVRKPNPADLGQDYEAIVTLQLGVYSLLCRNAEASARQSKATDLQRLVEQKFPNDIDRRPEGMATFIQDFAIALTRCTRNQAIAEMLRQLYDRTFYAREVYVAMHSSVITRESLADVCRQLAKGDEKALAAGLCELHEHRVMTLPTVVDTMAARLRRRFV